MTTSTPPRKARTRASLLAALQDLLLEPEPGAVSVPQVVSRCGVSQGTFYNHFDSLPAAIDAVGGLLLTEHTRVLETVTSGATDPAEIVARSARQTLMLLAFRPDVGRLLFDSGLPADRFLAGVRAHLHRDLQQGIDTGIFAVADFDVVSTVYAGIIMGASLDIHRGRLRVDAVPTVVEYLLGLLGVDATEARRLAAAPQEFVQWRPLPLAPGEI